jgi:uncharacterized protein GlcG (DUF336 family)
MGLFDSLFTPPAISVTKPVLDLSSTAVDKALTEAKADAPKVDRNTVSGGIVDDNGSIGMDIKADEALGKNFDAIEEASDSASTGWKIGAWIKGSWGKK